MPTATHTGLTESGEAESVASSDPQLPASSEREDTDRTDLESSRNTDDEIADGKRMKSKKTLKRKRRATEPSHFGATLQSLLNTDAPSDLPLSLKPSVAYQRKDAKLELEARKVVLKEREEREEKGRVRDVIGGWGGESERTLRKVAQRGVVKLFNTIQQSQLAAAATEEEARASRSTRRHPTAPAPDKKEKGRKGNISRVEKQTDKDTFFDMIRSGGVVSKV